VINGLVPLKARRISLRSEPGQGKGSPGVDGAAGS